jgi:diguanylate cyclase (GGDEF)-like protein
MYNLLTILCGRVERLTACLSDVKVLDDATGLSNRESFISLMNKEIQRARRYRTRLSLCLMKIEVDPADARLDLWQKETIMQSVGKTLTRNVRSCDLLGRCDPQIFGLLFPQTAVEKARRICDRLRFLLQHRHAADDGIQLNIAFGLSELSSERQETAPALFERAAGLLEQTPQASR